MIGSLSRDRPHSYRKQLVETSRTVDTTNEQLVDTSRTVDTTNEPLFHSQAAKWTLDSSPDKQSA